MKEVPRIDRPYPFHNPQSTLGVENIRLYKYDPVVNTHIIIIILRESSSLRLALQTIYLNIKSTIAK
jgi:hypothetical protein